MKTTSDTGSRWDTIALFLILLVLLGWFFVYCFAEKGRNVNAWNAEHAQGEMGIATRYARSLRDENAKLSEKLNRNESDNKTIQKNRDRIAELDAQVDRLQEEYKAYRTSIFAAHP